MGRRLFGDESKTRDDQQWVEAVDYGWPEGETYPAPGVVGVHDPDKKQFHREPRERHAFDSADVALVYLGNPLRPPNEGPPGPVVAEEWLQGERGWRGRPLHLLVYKSGQGRGCVSNQFLGTVP
jgi:hypothetical protein